MASCKTTQWTVDAPYVKLTVIKKASTTSNVTFAYRIEYISEKAITSEGLKNFTISMADTIISSGTFDLNNKTGINFMGAGNITLPITAGTQNISFSVSFDFKLPQPDGSIIDTLEASGSIPVSVNTDSAVCGEPTIVSAVDNNRNVIDVSCVVGANGIGNTAEGVELFITCDGTAPSETSYRYKYTLWGNTGERVSAAISFADLSK
jgi:hypothetical protein